MTELVTSYVITMREYQLLLAISCSTKRRPPPGWLLPSLITLWAAGVTLFVVVYRRFGEPWLLVAAMMLPIAFVAVMQVATRARLAPLADGALLGHRTLTVHERGVELVARDWELNARWDAITEVVETPTHVVLMMDTTAGTIIPRHALPTADALRPYLPPRLRRG